MLNSYESGGSKPLTNGHPPGSHGCYSHTGIMGQHSGATGQGSKLMRVISQLDSGRFDLGNSSCVICYNYVMYVIVITSIDFLLS